MKKSQSSDYFNKLEKTLAIDDEGNATFAKDVQADGTVGGNSGLKVIHEYSFTDDGDICKLGVFFETYLSYLNAYNFIGYLTNSEGEKQLCLGQYFIDNGQLTDIYAWYFYDTQKIPTIKSWSSSDNTSYYDAPALGSETQSKIYVHNLTLTADKSYTLTYYSSVSSSVNSVAGLRAVMRIRSASDSVILPVCATDLSATAALQVTADLCKVGAANITAFSDKVTEL